MTKNVTLTIAVCFVLCGAAAASRQASCIVKIEADPEFMKLDVDTLDRVIYSPKVAGQAFITVLGKELETSEIEDYLMFSGRSADMNAPAASAVVRMPSGEDEIFIAGPDAAGVGLICEIEVELADEKIPAEAERILAEVYSLFVEQIEEAYKSYIAQKTSNLERLQKNVSDAKKELEELNGRMAAFIENNSLPDEDIPELIYDISEDIEDAESSMQEHNVYLESLALQRETLRNQMREKLENDSVAKRLAEMIKVEETQLQTAKKQYEAGTVSNSGMAEAEKSLLTAQIELARRKEQIQDEFEDKLSGIEHRITESSMAASLKRVQMERLAKKRQQVQDMVAVSQAYDMQKLQIGIAESNLKEAMKYYNKKRQQVARLTPPVIVEMGL